MAEALRAKTVSPVRAERAHNTERRPHLRQLSEFAEKTFEELTAKEKNKLLKLVAVRLGLIKDSDDA